MKIVTTLYFILFCNSAFCQKTINGIYFGRNHNYSTIYSYDVTEVNISSDSILTRTDYIYPSKKSAANYKSYRSEKQVFNIRKSGNTYILINPISKEQTGNHILKINHSNLTYFFVKPTGEFLKGSTFKKIN